VKKQSGEQSSIIFLKALYQHCDEGFINLRFLPSAKNLFIPLSEIGSIPAILEIHNSQNVHFGVATRIEGDGSKNGIIQIPALWVDVDMEDLPEEKKDEIRQRYQNFPLKPSFLLNSGGGIHVYWLLKVPASKEEIPQVEDLLKRLVSYFNGDMSSTDASRILRIPKTLNYKYTPPREVTVMVFKPQKEYNLSDFDFLPELEERSLTSGEPIDKTENLQKVMECSFLKHCDEDRAILPEPEWYAMISILSRIPGGVTLIHNLSRGYPKYDPKETDNKILHGLDGSGPVTCEFIKSFWDCGKGCGVKSPASLVFQTPREDDLDNPEKDVKPGVNLKLTTLDDVFRYEEPQYLIDPILVERTVSVLGAYTGIGKSITALSIIKSILTSEALWGKYSVVKTGPVLLVDEETPQGFLRERIEKMGFNKGLPIYFLHFQDVRLDRDDCFNALMEKIEEVKPVLVVIDSLIRVHRQKEDDAMSMSFVVARLRKIANSGTTVLVIHHHKKGEGPLSQKLRGSSDIPGGVDIEYALVPKDNYLIFSSVKTRTKPLTPIRLKMEATEEKIEVVYQGTEIGERGEVLHEVINILGGGEAGVKEIWERVREEGFEVGERTFRDILRNATGKELLERTADRGKKFYRLNPGWQVGNPIYTCKPAKLEVSEEVRLAKDQGEMVNACQGQNLDNQCLDASLADLQKTICQGDKLNLYEGEI
jgi:hypothetical protein